MATAIHDFITLRFVGEQFKSFCNNTVFGIVVFLTTRNDIRLNKAFKTFHRGLLKETITSYQF